MTILTKICVWNGPKAGKNDDRNCLLFLECLLCSKHCVELLGSGVRLPGLEFDSTTHQLCDLRTTSQLLHFKTADVTSAHHKGLLRGLKALTHRKYLNHISLNTCYYVLIFKTALPKVWGMVIPFYEWGNWDSGKWCVWFKVTQASKCGDDNRTQVCRSELMPCLYNSLLSHHQGKTRGLSKKIFSIKAEWNILCIYTFIYKHESGREKLRK